MTSLLTRKHDARIGRWLALVLLVAQFGAEIHLYSHPLTDPSDRLGAARSCGTCLASSQLQNAVGMQPPTLPVRRIAWSIVVFDATVPELISESRQGYRSRAPPVPA